MGVQIVLPPGYRCCGHPQKGNGLSKKGDDIVTRNRVLSTVLLIRSTTQTFPPFW